MVSGLGVQSGAMRKEASGNDAAVVQNEQIAFAQEVREIAEHPVGVFTGLAIKGEHARAPTLWWRLLRNQFFGKFVVEIGNKHSGHSIDPSCASLGERTREHLYQHADEVQNAGIQDDAYYRHEVAQTIPRHSEHLNGPVKQDVIRICVAQNMNRDDEGKVN